MNQILNKSKKIFLSEQTSILSAANVIMVMTFSSLILGLLQKRVILTFFDQDQFSLFSAAFRLPDLVFSVLVYGMFASAFIPIFTKLLRRGNKEAWETASRTVNICLISFAFFAILIGIFADQFYSLIAPGYTGAEIHLIANLARVMFFAQGIFVISYVLTSVLESLRRFLIPALAPVFYNLGLIIGTVLLHKQLGLMAPAVGVVLGALTHFLIQLPLAYQLGFRFGKNIKPNDGVKDIAKLAAPRLVDLGFQQIADTVVLYFASLISVASYGYFTLANSLQAAPVRLFGTSLAKAALPTLTRENENLPKFRDILFRTIYQMFFLVAPVVTLLIVLRIPIVRILFGTYKFDWDATVETGMVLTGFSVGIVFQTFVPMLARGFYALHDTQTPVIISVIGDSFVIVSSIFLVSSLHMSSWALGFAYSIGAFIETIILLIVLKRKIKNFSLVKVILPLSKTFFACIVSGGVMYYLLKFFDKWDPIKIARPIAFQTLVIDTRYTLNLIVLTGLVAIIGMVIYIVLSFVLKSQELNDIWMTIWSKRGFILRTPTEPAEDLENGVS
ncbi:MAG TPA: murein biosynthesis integral membrane protein MurJ [Patescibacteria group bacterium]|nr:murein biosynthesis integral membrane protein MurJ [Patescibacteria group bacterium]